MPSLHLLKHAALMIMLIGLSIRPLTACADDCVARVAQFSGAVNIQRGADLFPAAGGLRLKSEDRLITGADGTIGIIFDDETTLSLGPGSELTIQDFIFDPDHSDFSLVVRLIRGTAAYVSGLIAKLSPESTRIITPSASIGVRGTHLVIEADRI